MANLVSVFPSDKRYLRAGLKIKNLGRRAASFLKKKNVGFEIYLLENGEMKALNRRFRDKNKVTNVLSFESETGPTRPDLKKNTRYLGEIFLAPDYIRTKGENLDLLFIHGFLHLLGYTHERKRDRIIMEKLEGRLSENLSLKKIDV